MSATENRVYGYLSPAHSGFWQWSADARTLDWSSGKTMAFREEIAALVTRLAMTGLPPIGALLLFRAACRDDWKNAITEQGSLASFFVVEDRKTPGDHTKIRPLGSSEALTRLGSLAFARLDALAELPADLRRGLPALCDLAESFFEGCHHTLSPQIAEAVAVEFAKGIIADALIPFTDDDAFEDAVQSLAAIATGAGVPTEKGQRLRTQTGLEAEPKPADIPVPTAARQLIRDLAGDPELGGVAAVARQLLAAVTLPRTLRPQVDLPVGGVSDVSNRGTLDRLLITELAHDDLTLAVRVATREALYLRRESPPAQPPQRRVLLVDAGIRMWGVARVYATAVALALAATADAKAEVLAFRPEADRLQEIAFATREGLVGHLAALDPAPHPAEALPAFTRILKDERLARTDAIIITHDLVLADPEFRRAVNFDDLTNLLIATVNRDGKFRLYHLTSAGRRLLAEASLSLDVLLADPPPERSLLRAHTGDLPVILSLHPLPLRVPHPFTASRSAGTRRHGLLMLNSHGALLQWQLPKTHARELANDLPGGRLLAILPDPASTIAHIVIVQKGGKVAAIAVDTATGKRLPSMEFPHRAEQPKGAGRVGDAIFTVYCGLPDVIHADTGDPLFVRQWRNPLTWVRDRFFRSEDHFYALANDGPSLRLEFVRHVPRAASVFERPSTDNPFFLMTDGRVIYHEPAGEGVEVERVVGSPLEQANLVRNLLSVSEDGSRITCAANHHEWQMDFLSGPPPARWKRISRSGTFADWPREGNLRKHIHAISFEEGEIILIGRKNQAHRIQFDENGIRLAAFTSQWTAKQIPFVARPAISRSFHLMVAKTPGGKVFLDSRGMIHFVPNNLSRAQVSIVLHDPDVAAWTSSGVTVGHPAFHSGEPVGTVAEVARLLRAFAKEAQ